MQDLNFLEHNDEALIFENQTGAKFRVELDDEVISLLRSALKSKKSSGRSVSPREIQTRLRAGSTAQEVAEALDLELSDVQRYEGPIVAEKRFMLESSQSVEVRTAEHDGDDPQLFGAVIEDRVKKLTNSPVTWSVWKEDGGSWMVQAIFTVSETEHEAVWSFDHKKKNLSPETSDAVNLSKQGAIGETLIPTLRAVETPERTSRFDSGAFTSEEIMFDELLDAPPEAPEQIAEEPVDEYTRRQKIEQRAISTDAAPEPLPGETADLLDALRKRRKDRENAVRDLQSTMAPIDVEEHDPIILSKPETPTMLQNISLDTVDIEIASPSDFADTGDVEELTQTKSKKGRPSVPSWDEILFGQRPDQQED